MKAEGGGPWGVDRGAWLGHPPALLRRIIHGTAEGAGDAEKKGK